MKILCQLSPGGSVTVRTGWKNVLESCGYQWRWFFKDRAIFDQFDEFDPNIFICTTYDLTPALIRCIAERPDLQIVLIGSNWGALDKEIKERNFPVVIITDKEKKLVEELKRVNSVNFVTCNYHENRLEGTMEGWRELGLEPKQLMNAADTFIYLNGEEKEEFCGDLNFIGGTWGYKAQVLDKWFIPLLSKYKVKIWGNQGWSMTPQYLGYLDENSAKHVFRSAIICPNFHEPHSQVFGFEAVERIYKVIIAGGFCFSDYVKTIEEDIFPYGGIPMAHTPEEFADLIDHYLKNSHLRLSYMETAKRHVLENHTYFDRIANMFDYLEMYHVTDEVYTKKRELLNGTM